MGCRQRDGGRCCTTPGVQATQRHGERFSLNGWFWKHALDWLFSPGRAFHILILKTTIVQGYADMEYPMMVNDGTNEDTVFEICGRT